MNLRKLSAIFCLLFQLPLLAQITPKSTYMFPIQPGQRNFLSGSMGEIRPNHFHAGLDIKTGGQTGLPVYASQDGYAARIKVSAHGYGNALYMKHPDGNMTLYGHLAGFDDRLEEYLLKKQYELQSFDVELNIPEGLFPYKKGDVIAKSGNTGSSAGPHLHFEIRDRNEAALNPLLDHGFDEIADTQAPVISRIAIKPLSADARVNGVFQRLEMHAAPNGKNRYLLKEPIGASGLIGLEINMYDPFDDTPNKNGVVKAEMFVNGVLEYSHCIDNIPFEYTRALNAHVDYWQHQHYGKHFQKCYVEDNNPLPIYATNAKGGRFTPKPGQKNEVSIKVSDAYGNFSEISFDINGDEPKRWVPIKAPSKISYELYGEVLKITVPRQKQGSQDVSACAKAGYREYHLEPGYLSTDAAVYLWEMREGIPDSVMVGGKTLYLPYKHRIPSNTGFVLFDQLGVLRFPKNSLADTLYLQFSKEGETIVIGDMQTPLLDYMEGELPPPANAGDVSKTLLYTVNNEKAPRLVSGQWENGRYKFKTKSLGRFVFLKDDKPPVISDASSKTSRARFHIGDNLSGVKTYSASLNGQWLLLEHDNGHTVTAKPLNKSIAMRGELIIKVTDAAGNISELRKRL